MGPLGRGPSQMKFFKSQEAAKAACGSAAKLKGVSYACYAAVPGEGFLVKLFNKFGQFAGFANVEAFA